MNEVLKAAAAARRSPARYKLSDAESQSYMAIRVFGIDSAEAKAARNYWHALKEQVRTIEMAPLKP
jgi:hypothetical protein